MPLLLRPGEAAHRDGGGIDAVTPRLRTCRLSPARGPACERMVNRPPCPTGSWVSGATHGTCSMRWSACGRSWLNPTRLDHLGGEPDSPAAMGAQARILRGRFVTRCRCRRMWHRQSTLAQNGKLDPPSMTEGSSTSHACLAPSDRAPPQQCFRQRHHDGNRAVSG